MAVQEIVISDYKNHIVKKGEIYSAVFNVNPVIAKTLSGKTGYITDPSIAWIEVYSSVGAGGVSGASAFVKAFLNKVLQVVTPVGPLSSKIKILWDYTYLFDGNTKLRVHFEVIDNPWPILYVVGAIGAIVFLYLTVREVRLYKQAAEGIQPAPTTSVTGSISETVGEVAKVAGGSATIILVAGIILYLIFNKK